MIPEVLGSRTNHRTLSGAGTVQGPRYYITVQTLRLDGLKGIVEPTLERTQVTSPGGGGPHAPWPGETRTPGAVGNVILIGLGPLLGRH